ncbi:MAG: sigma-70 family RNA polymerase sigma factor [Acidobacteriia bacterium]|nr:sigma-70 family RNA polymerase sigma factor [Terriglobia bacterium]
MAARENTAENLSHRFPTTSWTVISAAGGDSDGSAEALSKLCAAYWLPVYSYIRRKGHSREQAEDLTQAFFARILERRALAAAKRERGKFRSFLLASVTNFLANDWDRSQAQKRGAGIPALSVDFEAGEARYNYEPFHQLTPEALFERQWAVALLDRVLARLAEEHRGKGQGAHFERMQNFLAGDQERGSYELLAIDLSLTNAAARTAVHRLPKRYAELVREEVAAIVGGPEEVESEIRFLLAALERA